MNHDPYLYLPPLLPRLAGTCDPSPDTAAVSGSAGGDHAASVSPTDFSSTGLALIEAKRLEQILRWGHTPETDKQLPVAHFVNQIDKAAHSVREDLQFNKPVDHMRRHLVALGALVAAAIDRIEGID